METTLSTITIFPDNESEIVRYKQSLKNEILTSTMDPLEILKKLKYVERVIAEILEDPDIEKHFLNEAYLYEKDKGNNSFEHVGCNFSIQEVGTKYVFSPCGDVILSDLQKRMEQVKKDIKARETYLKSLPEEGAACPINGNILRRPIKTSKTKVVVNLV